MVDIALLRQPGDLRLALCIAHRAADGGQQSGQGFQQSRFSDAVGTHDRRQAARRELAAKRLAQGSAPVARHKVVQFNHGSISAQRIAIHSAASSSATAKARASAEQASRERPRRLEAENRSGITYSISGCRRTVSGAGSRFALTRRFIRRARQVCRTGRMPLLLCYNITIIKNKACRCVQGRRDTAARR